MERNRERYGPCIIAFEEKKWFECLVKEEWTREAYGHPFFYGWVPEDRISEPFCFIQFGDGKKIEWLSEVEVYTLSF